MARTDGLHRQAASCSALSSDEAGIPGLRPGTCDAGKERIKSYPSPRGENPNPGKPEAENWQVAAIHEGVRQADAGNFASEEDVKAAFARWGVNAG